MKSSTIILVDGWSPDLNSGDEVVAVRDIYAIKKGTVLNYTGGCDHPSYGWAIHLEGGKPNFFPGDTPRDVGTHNIAGYEFEQCFEKVEG